MSFRWLTWGLLLVLTLGCPTRFVGETDGGAGSGGSAGAAGASAGGMGESGRGNTGGVAGQGGAPSGGGSAGSYPGSGGLSDAGTTALDAGGGSRSDAAGMPTWCGQQTQPPGIMSVDYGCADFDNGLAPSGAWSAVLANGGTATVTMQRASSLPYSWSASVTNGDGSEAVLKWHVSGALPIATVTVAADFSPPSGLAVPWTGSVSLLCIRFGSGLACINYTDGGNTGFAAGPYTGYYLFTQHSGGGVVFSDAQLYGTLQPNLWTRVQMQITASSGSIDVTIPGGSNSGLSNQFGADSTVDVLLGPQTNGSTAGWGGYIDNVVVYVSRSK